MSNELYDVSQVLEKTLIAAQDLPVFDSYPTKNYQPKQIGIVKKGQPAGIVYSWVNADPANNRANLWWIFYPGSSTGSYYAMPHNAGYYDISALRQQGVITVVEQQEQEDEANKAWYEKVLDKALPVVLVAVLGGAFIRGLVSRKT